MKLRWEEIKTRQSEAENNSRTIQQMFGAMMAQQQQQQQQTNAQFQLQQQQMQQQMQQQTLLLQAFMEHLKK